MHEQQRNAAQILRGPTPGSGAESGPGSAPGNTGQHWPDASLERVLLCGSRVQALLTDCGHFRLHTACHGIDVRFVTFMMSCVKSEAATAGDQSLGPAWLLIRPSGQGCTCHSHGD